MYYLTNGGILMYVILIMSIIGLSAVIERFIHFRKYEKDNRTTLNKELRVMIEQGNIIDVVKKLHPEKSAVSRVLKVVLYDYYNNPNSSIEKLEEKGKERAMAEIAGLEKNMWIILQQIQTMYVRLNLDLYQTVAPSVKCLHMR